LHPDDALFQIPIPSIQIAPVLFGHCHHRILTSSRLVTEFQMKRTVFGMCQIRRPDHIPLEHVRWPHTLGLRAFIAPVVSGFWPVHTQWASLIVNVVGESSSRAMLGGRIKGGLEPLEKEIHEILGSKLEDRFSNPFFDLVQKTRQVLLRLGNLCKGPRTLQTFPQKCQKMAGY